MSVAKLRILFKELGIGSEELGVAGFLSNFAGMKMKAVAKMKAEKWLWAAVAVLAAVYVAAGSWLMLPDGDDAVYCFVVQSDPSWNHHPAGMRQIEDAGDVVKSQFNHYFHDGNGRAPVHVMLQTLLGVCGRGGFAVANGVVFVLVVWLLCRRELPDGRQRGPLLFLVNMLAMLVLFPARDTHLAMWASAAHSLNYLWVMLLVLVFLIALRRCDVGWRVPPVALCAALGLLAGWSNEAFAAPLGATLFLVWLRRRLRFRNAAEGVLCVAEWVGTVLILLSPQTQQRMASAGGTGNFFVFLQGTYACFKGINMLYILLAGLTVYFLTRRVECVRFVRDNAFMWLLWGVDLVFASVAHSASYSLCFLEFLSLILAVRLVASIWHGLFAGYLRLTSIAAAVFAGLAAWATVESVRIRRDAMEMAARLKASPDACTWAEARDVCPLVRPFTIVPLSRIAPGYYAGASMIILYTGRHDRLPMVVGREDYEGLYAPGFFGPERRLPGMPGAYEGRDHYYILRDSLPQGGAGVEEVRIDFACRDLSQRSALKRLLYKVRANGPYSMVVPADTFTAACRRLLVVKKGFADPVAEISAN